MHQFYLFDRGGFRFNQLIHAESSLSEELIAHHFELSYGEDMTLTNIGVIARCVEDPHLGREILAREGETVEGERARVLWLAEDRVIYHWSFFISHFPFSC